MKIRKFASHAAAAALLAAVIVAVTVAAQEPQQPAGAQPQAPAGAPPQGQPGEPPPQRPRDFPKPTNLKVLPKDLTGQQVRDIMEKWKDDLGVHCNTCHAADPNNVGPNGRPRMNFPDDSKPEKQTARLMYTMTNKINDDTISMVGDGTGKVTCGTCHRGHQKPEAFVPPPEHEGPRPGAPGGPAQPPIPR